MAAVLMLIPAVIAGVDLGIKAYVEKDVKENEERSIWRGRGIVRKVHNHGLMLNRMEKHPLVVRLASVFALGIVLMWQAFLMRKSGYFMEKVGASLMAGGALSNTCDRVKKGYVVDYVAFAGKNKKISDVTFNLGDFAIFGGAVLMALGGMFSGNGKKQVL